MAHGTKISGTAYGITGGKCLVKGTAYGIKNGRTLIGGTGYDISFGTPISAYSEGDIVKINESGSPVEFYVSKHDYESALNGAGRTLVVRKDGYGYRIWDDSNVNNWDTCSIRSWLNVGYKELLDSNIQAAIGNTTYYYTEYNTRNVYTRSDPIFLLSLAELGLSNTGANSEGSNIPISNAIKIAYMDEVAVAQWTRTISKSGRYAFYLYTNGEDFSIRVDVEGAVSRPVFTLPSTTIVGADGVIR